MWRCLTAVLLSGAWVAGAFAQQPGQEEPRGRSEAKPQDRPAAARPEKSGFMGPMLARPQNRPQPTATTRMVLIRFLIAQVTLQPGEQAAEGKPAGESGPARDARPAKSAIVAMPEETLFDAERLNKELQAAPIDLRASSDGIGARLSRLLKDRAVEIIERGQLTTLDEQIAYVMMGRREPRITSTSLTSKGRVSSTTLDNVGTQAVFTPHVHDNGRISLQVDIQKSQMAPLEEGVVIAELAGSEKVRAAGYETMVTQTMITVTPGQAVALAGVTTRRDGRRTECLVLVSADLLDRN